MAADHSAEAVLEENTPRLMRIQGVIGTALGSRAGKEVIRVFVTRLSPEVVAAVPKALEGYETSVEETGEFRAIDNPA